MRFYPLMILMLLCLAGTSTVSATTRPSMSISHITTKSGLSSNNVKDVFQDEFGFIWLGTKNGLNRYDGRYMRRFNCFDSELKRGNNNISAVFGDKNGNLWLGTDRGVYIYNMRLESFRFLRLKSKEGIGAEDWVADITNDNNGNVWVLIPNQGVFRIQNKGNDPRMSYYNVTNHGGDKSRLPECITLLDDILYVGSSNKGLYRYDPTSDRFHEVGTPEAKEKLHRLRIAKIIPMDKNSILVADALGNLLKYDINTEEVTPIDFRKGRDIYLRTCLIIDNQLWIGTQNCLYILNLKSGAEHRIDTSTMGKSGLSDNTIYTLYADREGNVWAGTMFGGVNYIQRNGLIFEKYTAGDSSHSLTGRLVRGMAATNDGHVWIGLEDGGIDRLDIHTGDIEHNAIPRLGKPHTLTLKSKGNHVYIGMLRNGFAIVNGDVQIFNRELHGIENSVYSLLEDRAGNLWVGLEWGLYLRRHNSSSFEFIDDIGNDWISNIFEDSEGTIWISSMGNGLYTYKPSTGKYKHYPFDEGYSNGLRSNTISSVTEARDGTIWVSTDRGGLSKYNPESDNFTTYSIAEGLPDNVVYDVLDDRHGHLWFGTNKGLVKFQPSTGAVKVFNSGSNDVIESHNYNSAVVGSDGRFYFGGIGGIIAFDPRKDTSPEKGVPVYLTDMRIGGVEITPGAEDSPLKEGLLYSDKIEIPYTNRTISFSIASPNYSTHCAISYSYRLLPNDTDWIPVSDARNLSFVNLNKGNYTLEIRATCGRTSSTHSYKLSILPPWYESLWAYAIYTVLTLLVALTAWRYYKRRQEQDIIHKANLISIQKEKELYRNKIQFFTEIAHEIRTPLSLISSPLEAIDEIGVEDKRVERYLKTIRLNTNRLLDLTSHLLDFQKIDGAQHSLLFESVDIADLTRSILSRFEPTISLRDKRLTVNIPDYPIIAIIDREAVTKIMSNLFNNALKYSQSRIEVTLSANDDEFTLSVASDGKPIEGIDRLKIFEPFYQIDNNDQGNGVGIGLPLASTLAGLHSGSLTLADKSALGNTFELRLPMRQAISDATPEPTPTMTEYVMDEGETSSFAEDINGYSMLLVEDNDEMRDFLSGQLGQSFSVETAANGKEALDILSERKFDIIVTDIMMPVMDGYEFCRQVKDNIDLSHIPVVFLTAKNDLESKVKALKCGGEAYIEKPFSLKFFRQQVMSLLNNRVHERKAFMKNPFFSIDNMKLNKADEEFMNKVIDIITRNISDESFNVESMADAFCMSRSSLLRRIKTIFNLSPVELIRIIRLKKAAELIQEGKYRIGDVCYMVGINSSSYFSKLFFKQFGVTPKNFEKQCQRNNAPTPPKDKITP